MWRSGEVQKRRLELEMAVRRGWWRGIERMRKLQSMEGKNRVIVGKRGVNILG